MSRRRLDSVHYSNLFEQNVNFRERVIYLNDDVSEFSLDLFQKALDEFERGENPEPIRIEISSYGGSVYDMLGMLDRMRNSTCHIVTRGFGKVMSAATFILAAGDERVLGRNSWLMIHELSDWLGRQKLADLKNDLKHNETLQKQLYAIYEDLSKNVTKAKTFEKLCQKDCYLTPEETLKLGIIDKIL